MNPKENGRVIVLHVPKTGGGTIRTVLRERNVIEPLYTEIVDKHFSLATFFEMYADQPIKFVTAFRYPIPRVISLWQWHFQHELKEPKSDDWYVRSFDRFMEHEWGRTFWEAWQQFGSNVDEAAANFEKHPLEIACFAPGHFDEGVRRIVKAVGFELPEGYKLPDVHASPVWRPHQARDAVTKARRKELESILHKDLDFHNRCVAIYNERRRLAGKAESL